MYTHILIYQWKAETVQEHNSNGVLLSAFFLWGFSDRQEAVVFSKPLQSRCSGNLGEEAIYGQIASKLPISFVCAGHSGYHYHINGIFVFLFAGPVVCTL